VLEVLQACHTANGMTSARTPDPGPSVDGANSCQAWAIRDRPDSMLHAWLGPRPACRHELAELPSSPNGVRSTAMGKCPSNTATPTLRAKRSRRWRETYHATFLLSRRPAMDAASTPPHGGDVAAKRPWDRDGPRRPRAQQPGDEPALRRGRPGQGARSHEGHGVALGSGEAGVEGDDEERGYDGEAREG